jgi:hypothetical protein
MPAATIALTDALAADEKEASIPVVSSRLLAA